MNRALTMLVATLALEAHTSEHHERVALELVLSRSTLVAIVEPASPPTKKTEIPIGPAGTSNEKAPPYVRVQQRYVVKEILSNRSGPAPAAGSVLEVDEGDASTRRHVHEAAQRGTRKIPIYWYYQPAETPDAGPGAPVIVFLRRGDEGWEFTATGAVEPVSQRARVAELIARAQRSP